MRLLTTAADATTSFPKLSLSLASTREEVREVQRLRYKIFIETMGLSALANDDGIDADEFDAYCDHLIVRDSRTLKVSAPTVSSVRARRANWGAFIRKTNSTCRA